MKLPMSVLTLVAVCLVAPANAENLEHTQQLMNTRECHACDLSGAGLIYANLAGADLSEADLTQANLSRVNLNGANLRKANLAGAVLFSANLTGANLRDADLRGADLRNAVLTGADFQGANIEGANLLGAIGLPSQVATVENYYLWGLAEAQRGNFRAAIANYNQALTLQPDFAHAYLARGISRLRLRDQAGGLQDGQRAEQLYLAQGNQDGQQMALKFTQGIQAIEQAQAEAEKAQSGGGGGGNFLNFLGSLAGLALQLGTQYFLP